MTLRRIVQALGISGITGALLLLVVAPTSEAHKGFTLESLEGRWGFNEESVVAGQPGFSTGIFRFDDSGGCTLTFAEAGGGSATPKDWDDAPRTCDYTIDRHGKGSISGLGMASLRFVLTEHGTLIRYALCCQEGFSGRGEMNRL